MANVLWGIGIVLACIAGYTYAWRLNKEGRYSQALLCIIICGLILRVYAGADLSLHDWDERYHALVAKNLLKHFLVPTLYDTPLLPYDYRDWTSNHIWLHKQPLSLWLISISIRLFGVNAFAVRIPAIVLSTIGIKLMYDIAKRWYNERVGMLSAFLFSIHGLIIELASGRAGTDHIDAIFLFFIVLAVWVAIKAVGSKGWKWHLLFGAVVGLGVLTKWLPALIGVAIWAIIAYPYYRGERAKMLLHFSCIAVAIIIVALPWQLYILYAFPQEASHELAYNSRHLFQSLEAHEGSFFYHFDHLRMKYGEAIYLPVLWFTWYGIKHRRSVDYAVLVWFWGTYLFFSVAATKMEAYTVIAAPAVFIISAVAFFRVVDEIGAGRRYQYLWMVGCAALLLLPIRYSIERVKPFTVLDRNPDWNKRILILRKSDQNSPKTVIFGCKHPIETMFFTECVAYERIAEATTVADLLAKGYKVVIAEGY